jgi:molybdopterin synthase sulfur carrier subunit
MTIQVKFFASLREQVGQAETRVQTAGPLSVAEVWSQATDNRDLPGNILMALNMEYVDANATVRDGDEVAFFPPVTGG